MPARGTPGFAGEAGHSLVEVLVSIVILCVAIIPMVSMFDVGLSLATGSGHRDAARAFANEQLEIAAAMPYEAVRDAFPVGAGVPGTGVGYSLPQLPSPVGPSLPAGATYAVFKRFVRVVTPPAGGGSAKLEETATDGGMLRLEVVVAWDDRSHAVSGVVAEDSR